MLKRFMVLGVLLGSINFASGQLPIQKELDDLNVSDRWSYNDWDAAQAAAAKSKKPILALFRCVP